MHPLAPVGTLFAVTVWPLLAAFLLFLTPENRQSASSRTFAVAGLAITPLAVWLMPGTDALAAACSCIVTAIPLLLPQARVMAPNPLPCIVQPSAAPPPATTAASAEATRPEAPKPRPQADCAQCPTQ